MDIAFVVHRYDASEGTGGYVTELLPRVAREHDVTLYAAQVRAAVPEGTRVVPVRAAMLRMYTAILTFPAAFRAVRRKHDLVHAQGWVTGTADVVTAHIVLAAWRRAAKAARVRTPLGERYLGGFVEQREARLFARGARHVIAPSEKAKREIAESYGREEGVTVVRHGFPEPQIGADGSLIDAETARERLSLPRGPLLALFVGDVRKGLHAAIKAVAQVPDVHLGIVSYSSPSDTTERAREAGASDRVHWIGPQSDVSIALAAADILLHPTIYDSFGLVVAEAMAQGIPSVVTANAGVSELLTHRESGWIVDGDAAEGTAAALRELAHNAELRQRIGRHAQHVAAARTWDDVARETMAVYDEVAGR